jgi:hypothetical protein
MMIVTPTTTNTTHVPRLHVDQRNPDDIPEAIRTYVEFISHIKGIHADSTLDGVFHLTISYEPL